MRPLFPAWLLVGCTSAATPDAGVDAAPDTSTTLDSALPDVATDAALEAEADADEGCAPPLFPPRTDGCPCQPSVGPCNKDNVGKVCDYFGFCPSSPTRTTCTLVKPSEGAPYYSWTASFVPCPGTEAGRRTPATAGRLRG
ncbi:MAG: hypothetical protein IPJ34_27580 [Myxococcales bacterium]|nr:hypothetical protein [Myxococcales bacterium]